MPKTDLEIQREWRKFFREENKRTAPTLIIEEEAAIRLYREAERQGEIKMHEHMVKKMEQSRASERKKCMTERMELIDADILAASGEKLKEKIKPLLDAVRADERRKILKQELDINEANKKAYAKGQADQRKRCIDGCCEDHYDDGHRDGRQEGIANLEEQHKQHEKTGTLNFNCLLCEIQCKGRAEGHRTGTDSGIKQGIAAVEKAWKTIRRHPNMTGQEVFEKAIAAARCDNEKRGD